MNTLRFGNNHMQCAMTLAIAALTASYSALAQDSAFLKCADIPARDARVLCLEQALDAAVGKNSNKEAQVQKNTAPAAVTTTPAIVPGKVTTPASTPSIAEPKAGTPVTTTAESSNTSKWDLFGLLGKKNSQAKTEQDAALEASTMHAKVASLQQYKTNAWQITLDNGQVWRQLYSESFLLRAGDAIKIYPSGWGDQFRLETETSKSFLRVQRIH